MADEGVSDARRRNMAAIKAKNTTPELLVRRHLHAKGLRFTLHDSKLPGKPDIVLSRLRTVIHVHGCFWHHHNGCVNSVWPKNRADFWREKISGTIKRDRRNDRALRSLGWRVVTIWECEAESSRNMAKILNPIVRRHRRISEKRKPSK
jgi:DNA mismatch endonuclease (patch repair protein)